MEPGKPFRTKLSALFMTATLMICSLSSYAIGNIAKAFLENEINLGPEAMNLAVQVGEEWSPDMKMGLPVPLAKEGKVIPPTIYTSKNFDTRRSAYSSQWLQKEDRSPSGSSPDTTSIAPQNLKLSEWNESSSSELGHGEEDEEHLPAGQHLLVDIDGLDHDFLNSEKQLATAMIELVDSSGLTLLSYHCHGLTPAGVSCAGVLLESHVSFHTWPAEGVITLDLFTCGSTSLLNSLHLIEDLFVIPRKTTSNNGSPRMLWAYKRRGFKEQSSLTGERDTFAYPLGIHGLDLKKEIASTQTSGGKDARIYDINNLYQMPSSSSADLETHPHLFLPNRLLYLDGVLKASASGEIAAFESSVHPTMVVHENPRRVLVLGAGTGASIREVLKHSSVEQVVVVGADEALVQFSQQHLRDWNDCSDLVESTDSCFDDPRVHLVYDHANNWLSTTSGRDLVFDVILVDSFDLDEEDARALMDDQAWFFSALHGLLDKDGVVSVHASGDVRAVDSIATKRMTTGARQRTERQSGIATGLANVGFPATEVYEETETGLIESRYYVVAFKAAGTAEKWSRSESEVNAEIRKRCAATKSGETSFKFFDGATMTSYSRASSNDTQRLGRSILHEIQDRTVNKVSPSPTMDSATMSVEGSANTANQSLEMDECVELDDAPHQSDLPRGKINYHES